MNIPIYHIYLYIFYFIYIFLRLKGVSGKHLINLLNVDKKKWESTHLNNILEQNHAYLQRLCSSCNNYVKIV